MKYMSYKTEGPRNVSIKFSTEADEIGIVYIDIEGAITLVDNNVSITLDTQEFKSLLKIALKFDEEISLKWEG